MKKFSLIFLSGFILVTGCKKEPGEVEGVVMRKIYDNDFVYLQRIEPAPEYDVYICDPNNAKIIDRVRSSYNGCYYFSNLEDGKYKIYVYEDDTTLINSKVAAISSEISVEAGHTTKVDTLFAYKNLNIDNGNSTITGKIWVINYKSNGYEIKDISEAQEVDVYLIYGNHKSYDIRTRTNYDGTFQFSNLIKGNYTVYVYSEAEDQFGYLTNATQKEAHKKFISITSDRQEVAVTDTIKIF
jgi:hypothetical protein